MEDKIFGIHVIQKMKISLIGISVWWMYKR